MSYRYDPRRRFVPKRSIRSFMDLGIYQATEKISVEVVKKIIPLIPDESPLKKDLVDCCMKIPHFIAEAHSRRFDDKPKSMKLLEETLFLCNKVVVYMEQARDIYGMEPKSAGAGPASATAGGAPTSTADGNIGIERVVVDEIIKKYFYARQKVFNFYKAWKKFQTEEKNSHAPQSPRHADSPG